jgi:membrane protease subunit HflC
MQAYNDMISKGTTLILTTDSDIFKFLRGMEAGTTAESDIPPDRGTSTVVER